MTAKTNQQHITALIKTGDFDRLQREYPKAYFMRIRTIDRIRDEARRDHQIAQVPASLPAGTKHIWLYGTDGYGATSYCHGRYPGFYHKNPSNSTWMGYQFEEVVVLDTFRDSQFRRLVHLKRWASCEAFEAAGKGFRSALIRPRLVIVVAYSHPNEIWKGTEDREAIASRFNIIHVGKGGMRYQRAINELVNEADWNADI